jgi:hypothetical protein
MKIKGARILRAMLEEDIAEEDLEAVFAERLQAEVGEVDRETIKQLLEDLFPILLNFLIALL